MTMKLLAGAALAAMIAAAPALAQDAPPPPPGKNAPGRPMAPRAPVTRAAVEKMVADHFAEFDLNHDGVVTRGEIVDARDAMHAKMMKEARDRLFDRLDTNKDGTLSRAEFAAPPAPRAGDAPDGAGTPPRGFGGPEGPGHRGMKDAGGEGRPPMGGPGMMMMGPHWFERADTDHDGKITLAEAKAAALAAFDRIDTNHDGVIGPEERRAAMRAMAERGGERGPGRDGPDGGPPPPPQD